MKVKKIGSDQEDFWSSNPCGSSGKFDEVRKQRYFMEPYLPYLFDEFPSKNTKILEIGCGQGVDAITISSRLASSCTYDALDYSKGSILMAKNHLNDILKKSELSVKPKFQTGNALALDFKNASFDMVYSMGVFHHTPDVRGCINEAHRVLKPGGKAVIFLYHRYGPKIFVAQALRNIAKVFDPKFGMKGSFFRKLQWKQHRFLGTMLLECFGVPILDAYDKKEAQKLFSSFSTVHIEACGFNFPWFVKDARKLKNPFGPFLKITVLK